MTKRVKAIPKKTTNGKKQGAYVKFDLKMLYISSDAMLMMNGAEYISMAVNGPGRVMQISPAPGKNEYSFKLSRVNETEYARRIETNNGLRSVIDSGFPLSMLGKRLPVVAGLDGSLIVDLRPQIPIGSIGSDTEAVG